MPTHVLLIHGAATDSRVWKPVIAAGDWPADIAFVVPDRPCAGGLDAEIEALAGAAADALVVGVSGGATLVLELAQRGVAMAGGIAHEPAAGFLAPELLEPMVRAFDEGGPEAFGRALYGEQWQPAMAGDLAAVGRDLKAFRSFDPAPPESHVGPVLTTVGEQSPQIRHDVATRYTDVFGYPSATIPNSGHFVQRNNPAAFAGLIAATWAGLSETMKS